jgi:predicted nicotinamide N-methyase
VVAAGAGAAAVGAAAAGARRHCSASLDKRCHGQVSHFPAALGRRAASRMLYCPRRKRTGARLLVAARFHSRINGLADECVEHMLYLLDLASAGFSRPV